jgi:hypothetical protein
VCEIVRETQDIQNLISGLSQEQVLLNLFEDRLFVAQLSRICFYSRVNTRELMQLVLRKVG